MSVATFVAALQAMTVTSVTRHYDQPPESVDTADLPVAYPDMPNGERAAPVSTCVIDSKIRRMDYVILIEATGQGTVAARYAQIAPLMDNLETALDAVDLGTVLKEYTMTSGVELLAGQEYTGIRASITGRNA